MTLSPEVLAIAEAQAAKDRDLLAALRLAGRAMKSGSSGAFVRDIEARAWPKHPSVITGGKINLAIRPNKKRRHK